MNELMAAYWAHNDNPTDDNLNAFIQAVHDALAVGVTLPENVRRRFSLATGAAQPLPPVVVTERQPVPLWVWLAGAAAVVFLAVRGNE